MKRNRSASPERGTTKKSRPDKYIEQRCLISDGEAALIIGTGGTTIRKIMNECDKRAGTTSAAHVSVTPRVSGSTERILVVKGIIDNVAMAFGLVARILFDEPFESASLAGSQVATFKFLVEDRCMGAVIGKKGSKMREIQEQSGARVSASETPLPGSSERVVSVTGVADAVHIAIYYVGLACLALSTSTTIERKEAPIEIGEDEVQEIVSIPEGCTRSLIGKGGSKINALRKEAACRIIVQDKEQKALVIGDRERVTVGVQLIQKHIDEWTSRDDVALQY